MAESPELPLLPARNPPGWRERIIGLVIGTAVIILVGLAVLRYWNPGTVVQISKNERVYYSGNATEHEARALGGALKKAGWFTGQREGTALLRQTAKDGTIVSLVTNSQSWEDPHSEAFFTALGREIAPSVGGPPITVELVDGWRKVKKTIPIK